MTIFKPSEEILKKYADVLVNFALNDGKGIKKGDSVLVRIPESAKLFYAHLRRSIMRAGGNPIFQYQAEMVNEAEYYNLATDQQLDSFADRYFRGIVDQFDHAITIIAEANKYEFKDVDPQKRFRKMIATRKYREWLDQKETEGHFTWTLALYGTLAMAKDVGMNLQEYWQQISQACYLDEVDPIKKWKATYQEITRIQKCLNALSIDKVKVESEGVDLEIKIGPNRQWLGASGRNIPSFEIFISPDWRGTEGYANFNQPLYYMGNKINKIQLKFAKGEVVYFEAKQGEAVLREMIKVTNANKLGEFSLTDNRFSRITKVMGETLFDENIGGNEGNFHIALGKSYKDSYGSDQNRLSDQQWAEYGYNQSTVHTDIISTQKRIVTAFLVDGTHKVIYENGRFTL